MSCNSEYDGETFSGKGDFNDTEEADDTFCGEEVEPSPWEFIHTVNPLSNSDENPEDVKGSGKYFWVNSFFEQVPEGLVPDESGCSGLRDQSRCEEVTFLIRQGYNSEPSEYNFEQPSPNNSGGNEGSVYETGVDIASSLASHPIASAGIAAMGSWFSPGSSSTVDYSNFQDDGRWNSRWAIGVDGSNIASFPDDPCDTHSVRYKLSNLTGSGQDEREVLTYTKYLFELPEVSSSTCCSDPGGPLVTYYQYETPWAFKSHDITLY